MTRIVVDESLRGKLLNLQRPLELCDESGKVLGRLFPNMELSHYEPLEPQISDEEGKRRLQANEKRYTTAEVLAHLENL